MLTMKVLGIVPNERPYTAPTITWHVEFTYQPDDRSATPIVREFNIPRGAAYISGPGYADDVFRALMELSEDEYLDLEEMASALMDYEPESHTPEERAQAQKDAEALMALGAKISENLAPILEAMGPQDD